MFGAFVLFVSNITMTDVLIKKPIYEVYYSQKLEQPLWLSYESTNRPTNVNRGSMDFYSEKNIKTSDHEDYAKNVYDSYLNCTLQNQYLNRGEWRLLEEQERKWDDKENLFIKITLDYNKTSIVLPTNATIPNGFTKHIFFKNSKEWKCYHFPNKKPEKGWEEHKITCKH